MSKQAINQYYNRLDQYKRFGGTRNESSIRRAFANLLEEYCLAKNLILVDELHLKGSQKRPDGTVKDALQLDWGHWESKDSKDDIDSEIAKKCEAGYPTDNILFEDSETIVLIQHGEEVLRGNMRDAEILDRILTAFIEYERPEISDFRAAIDKFREDIPDILEALRSMIAEQADKNAKFQKARDEFWTLCKDSINPDITAFDIREMLIQHILTAEIFTTVFGEGHFHRENNVARELENVINTFFTGAVRRNTLARIDNYYKAITTEASRIDNHHEKQKFLKVIYENFYKAYNPKGADKLGIIYTPNEIVKFIIESTDYLLEKHFGKSLADENVEILDPATGTGTFITDIIEYIPPQYLEYKYKHEVHANEVAILPYYIANLNIEYTYQQKIGTYEPFENIVFVDTLDNLGFGFAGKQESLFGFSVENLERIKRQNERKISVILGNPPYNAKQQGANEMNRNRKYPQLDKRITETYSKYSKRQNKNRIFDMYSRFFRWASDRVDQNGIVAFVSNSSFVDTNTYDGFRKVLGDEFSEIYIVNLKGDARTTGERRKKEAGNVFDDQIRVGIAVYFMIKKEASVTEQARIFYNEVGDYLSSREKRLYLAENKLQDLKFKRITPDKNNNWINVADNDFEELLPLVDKSVKKGKSKEAICKLYSLGIITGRDDWMTSFDHSNLTEKAKYFIEQYESDRQRWLKRTDNTVSITEFVNREIKWTDELEANAAKNVTLCFSKEQIAEVQYRPYVKKLIYYDNTLNHRHHQLDHIFCGENRAICLTNHKQVPFVVQSTIRHFEYGYGSRDTQGIPLFYYDKTGRQIENITDWGLKQFTSHYQDSNITKEAIFYYIYGVLHNPIYRQKYKVNLKRQFPRIPFYDNFSRWSEWGKNLMVLHTDYEAIEPYSLTIREADNPKDNPKVKLTIVPKNGKIILDENTSLLAIPEIAWEYKLGNYPALRWVLEQYKEKKPRDDTVAEKFNPYKFAEYKEQVIDLLKRVCTVSVKTMEIIHEMEAYQETE